MEELLLLTADLVSVWYGPCECVVCTWRVCYVNLESVLCVPEGVLCGTDKCVV